MVYLGEEDDIKALEEMGFKQGDSKLPDTINPTDPRLKHKEPKLKYNNTIAAFIMGVTLLAIRWAFAWYYTDKLQIDIPTMTKNVYLPALLVISIFFFILTGVFFVTDYEGRPFR